MTTSDLSLSVEGRGMVKRILSHSCEVPGYIVGQQRG
jgi:hypothetical protein